jgi:hypothetical protein
MSRDLDAALAEKLFGAKVELVEKAWSDDDWLHGDYPTETDCIGIVNPNFKPGGPTPPAWVVPGYSTTWEGMGLVVEEMRERGFCVEIEYGPGSNSVVYATFVRTVPRAHGHAKTKPMPEAVARAARAALEEDDG